MKLLEFLEQVANQKRMFAAGLAACVAIATPGAAQALVDVTLKPADEGALTEEEAREYEKTATPLASATGFVDKGRLARALRRLETFGTGSPDTFTASDTARRPGVLTIEAGAWTITATVTFPYEAGRRFRHLGYYPRSGRKDFVDNGYATVIEAGEYATGLVREDREELERAWAKSRRCSASRAMGADPGSTWRARRAASA